LSERKIVNIVVTNKSMKIASTFTSEPIARVIKFLLGGVGLGIHIEFAAFNQVFQELLDPTSSFSGNSDGVNICLVRLEDLAANRDDTGALLKNGNELCGVVRSAADRFRVPLVFVFCPPSMAAISNRDFSLLLTQLEKDLIADLTTHTNMQLIGSAQLSKLCTIADYDNHTGNLIAAVPYTERFYAILGQRLARTAYGLLSLRPKVIVLDCDQTLWKGICGEDGPLGIEIDEPHRFLQDFMVTQYKAGVLLCLCSKNNEPDVWEVFAKNSGMLIRREHIVSSRINWGPKSENIRDLARELQLSLESFIFVDDDPVVCAEVEANCPQVLTICLPNQAEEFSSFFQNHWAFDRMGTTKEDARRTEMYHENAARDRLFERSTNLQDFVDSLELQVGIAPMRIEHLERVAQLTQRTNQFNATTIRRGENEIKQLLADERRSCLVVHVRDRFGDYGLVGAVIYFDGENELEVDTFLLSCRALGRGVEHRMISALGHIASDKRMERVAIKFVKTSKNLPVEEFLETTGTTFKEASDEGSIYSYPTGFAKQIKYVALAGTEQPAETRRTSEADDADLNAMLSSKQTRDLGLHRIASELHRVDALLSYLEPDETNRPDLKTTYVPPDDDVEIELVNLWQQLLHVQPVGVLDNFFELGGDSLIAVTLFVEIVEKFDKQLPLATLFTAPTIRELARIISSAEREAQWRHLVPIQPAGSRPPLFCMHAAGGNVLFYRDISNHLGIDQPVYGLQARETEETGTYPNRVEDMAALYVSEILEFEPAGPYYLCGSSFGGLLAYEVAQQIGAQGKAVALLALFDTYGPGYPRSLPRSNFRNRKQDRLWSRITNLRGQLRELEAQEKLNFIIGRVNRAWMRNKRRWLWKKNEFQIMYNKATGGTLPKDVQRNHKAIQQALDTYVPLRYEGKVTLFRASTQPDGIVQDPLLGWGDLPAGGIEVLESVGTHGAMTVDPYAKALAEKLVAYLGESKVSLLSKNDSEPGLMAVEAVLS
jgi:FkbH-like protein